MARTNYKSRGSDNNQWGREAEQIAVEYLIKQGYTIRERNWKVGNRYEIDIIAELECRIIFIEVKARSGNHQSAEEAVDQKKCDRIVRGGDIYLKSIPYLVQYRFDIITITGSRDDYSLNHYEDAFLPTVRNR